MHMVWLSNILQIENITKILLFIHKTAGILWLGEVFVINFILIPVALSLERDRVGEFVKLVFPRVFRIASVLSATTVISGILLFVLMTRGNFDVVKTDWGINIVVGGVLGTLLTIFHFLAEPRMKKILEGDLDRFLKVIRFVPRAGLVVIFLTYFFMATARF